MERPMRERTSLGFELEKCWPNSSTLVAPLEAYFNDPLTLFKTGSGYENMKAKLLFACKPEAIAVTGTLRPQPDELFGIPGSNPGVAIVALLSDTHEREVTADAPTRKSSEAVMKSMRDPETF